MIGREACGYALIMGRTKAIPDADYARLVSRLEQQGYDTSKIRKVPQR